MIQSPSFLPKKKTIEAEAYIVQNAHHFWYVENWGVQSSPQN